MKGKKKTEIFEPLLLYSSLLICKLNLYQALTSCRGSCFSCAHLSDSPGRLQGCTTRCFFPFGLSGFSVYFFLLTLIVLFNTQTCWYLSPKSDTSSKSTKLLNTFKSTLLHNGCPSQVRGRLKFPHFANKIFLFSDLRPDLIS